MARSDGDGAVAVNHRLILVEEVEEWRKEGLGTLKRWVRGSRAVLPWQRREECPRDGMRQAAVLEKIVDTRHLLEVERRRWWRRRWWWWRARGESRQCWRCGRGRYVRR